MRLTLVDMPDGFDSHEGFNEQWWRPRMFQRDSTLLSAIDERGAEVGRIEMIDRTYPGEYVGVVESRDLIKIQFIEVRTQLRRMGVGSMILDLLDDRYPDRRLVAFSEADGFWDSTGWRRHIHREDDPSCPRHQALYIQT